MHNQFHLITNLPFSGFFFSCQALRRRSRLISTSLILFIFTLTTLHAQEPHVPYVTTPPGVVDKMMEMADVGPGDYVIDLGSGDGRIVIDAAKRGAVGHGVEIDPVLVNLAEENAREAGVSDKVMFPNSKSPTAKFMTPFTSFIEYSYVPWSIPIYIDS